MKEKRSATRFIICTMFALSYLAVAVPSVRSYPPFLNRAKQLGLPAQNCTYCHVNAAGGEPYNERGKWLIAEKGRRGAASVDVAWLKEYRSGTAAAGSTPTGGATASTSRRDQSGGAEQDITAIETLNREWVEAMVRRDATALERILADDYITTNSTGRVATKEQVIAGTKGAPSTETGTLESLDAEDQKLRVYGDTAVLTALLTFRGNRQGQAYSEPQRVTIVYVKRQGRWQPVVSQATRTTQ